MQASRLKCKEYVESLLIWSPFWCITKKTTVLDWVKLECRTLSGKGFQSLKWVSLIRLCKLPPSFLYDKILFFCGGKMSSLYWNCDSVQGAWIYLRLRAVSLAAVKKKRTAQKHKKHEVRGKEEKENKLASKKVWDSHYKNWRCKPLFSLPLLPGLSSRALNLSSMTSCLPSSRHGYMTVGQDLTRWVPSKVFSSGTPVANVWKWFVFLDLG